MNDREFYYRFREDETVDFVVVRFAEGKVVREERYASQYRRADRETIEYYHPVPGWTRQRLTFDGDQLTMFPATGEVKRLERRIAE